MSKKKKAKKIVVTTIPKSDLTDEEIETIKQEVSALPVSEAIPIEALVLESEPSDYMKWLDSAPVARGNLTQRWYGETFIPEYKAWLEEGKKFDK